MPECCHCSKLWGMQCYRSHIWKGLKKTVWLYHLEWFLYGCICPIMLNVMLTLVDYASFLYFSHLPVACEFSFLTLLCWIWSVRYTGHCVPASDSTDKLCLVVILGCLWETGCEACLHQLMTESAPSDWRSRRASATKNLTASQKQSMTGKGGKMKTTSSGKEAAETRTARDESVRKTSSAQEIFIPVKMSSVILISWFSSPILETDFWQPTVRVWGKQRTSERFQHASLSITQILYRNSLLVVGYKNKHQHSSTCLDEKVAS